MDARHLHATLELPVEMLGHLFGGRYKAQSIDERTPTYLRSACDYVHLNPDRAHLLEGGARLESYPWSQLPRVSETDPYAETGHNSPPNRC
jgi:hypothetical protein